MQESGAAKKNRRVIYSGGSSYNEAAVQKTVSLPSARTLLYDWRYQLPAYYSSSFLKVVPSREMSPISPASLNT